MKKEEFFFVRFSGIRASFSGIMEHVYNVPLPELVEIGISFIIECGYERSISQMSRTSCNIDSLTFYVEQNTQMSSLDSRPERRRRAVFQCNGSGFQ